MGIQNKYKLLPFFFFNQTNRFVLASLKWGMVILYQKKMILKGGFKSLILKNNAKVIYCQLICGIIIFI